MSFDKKEYQRAYMRKKREKNLSGEGEHQPPKNEVLPPVDHAGIKVDGNDLSPAQATIWHPGAVGDPNPARKEDILLYDKKKYPNRHAWEMAVQRVERAIRYARKFPDKIGTDDLKFQTLDWQYQNEGIKGVK